MSKNAPFKCDIVGSFLRPERLKEARANYTKGIITEEELTKVEDEEIKNLIDRQKQAGLQVITDGEFRRSWWHLDFMWGFHGIDKVTVEQGYVFKDEVTRGESAAVTGKISGEQHPFVEHFAYVKLFEDENVTARQTIPSPAQLLAELQRNTGERPTSDFYQDEDTLCADIAKAYKTVILDLYDAGCRNIQLDDCTWGMLADANYQKFLKQSGVKLDDVIAQYVNLNNLAIAGLPDDLVITTHVCRGNYHSTWASSGGYESVADGLFGYENVAAYYLEFDDERSGDFKPLSKVTGEKQVVLGLITSKSPKLENKDLIRQRIIEATEYIPLERLCLSPQCGFASTEEGNILTEEEQWKKIALVKEIAQEVWGDNIDSRR